MSNEAIQETRISIHSKNNHTLFSNSISLNNNITFGYSMATFTATPGGTTGGPLLKYTPETMRTNVAEKQNMMTSGRRQRRGKREGREGGGREEGKESGRRGRREGRRGGREEGRREEGRMEGGG